MVIIRDEKRLPLKLLESNYLVKAVNNFSFAGKRNRILIHLSENILFKKCFVYLFWIYFGLKFKDT